MAGDEEARFEAAVESHLGVAPVTKEPVTLVLTGSRWTKADGTVHYVTRCGVFRPEELEDWRLTLVPAAAADDFEVEQRERLDDGTTEEQHP